MTKHFNKAPNKVRQSDEIYQFVKESKQYYLDKAFSRIWDENYTVKYTEFIDLTLSFSVESFVKVTTCWKNE